MTNKLTVGITAPDEKGASEVRGTDWKVSKAAELDLDKVVLFDVEAGAAVDAIVEGTNIDIDVLCVEEPFLIVDVKNEVFTLVAKVGLRVVRVAVDIMGVVLLPVGAAMCGLEGKLLMEEAD